MRRVRLLEVSVSAVTRESARAEMLRWIAQGTPHYVAVSNVHLLVEAQRDENLRGILNRSGMTVPDGMPLVWLARRAGAGQTERVVGVELMDAISRALAERGGSVFYYGGAEGVAAKVASIMEGRYPGLRTAGAHTPPFRMLSSEEEHAVAALINASGADVVWVALGAPKQEYFMARMQPQLVRASMVGIGAAFSYLTGEIERAPLWMQRSGLEWCYRLWQEPRRLWRRYAVTNTLFVWYLLRERMSFPRRRESLLQHGEQVAREIPAYVGMTNKRGERP